MKFLVLFSIVSFLSIGSIHGQTVKHSAKDSVSKVHCAGTTKAGTPCKNYAVKGTIYCRVHNPATPRCGAPTAKGEPCQVVVKKQGDHCWRHKA